jgi:LPS-assembly lipoprotein
MSLYSRRNFLLLLGALPLAACGYQPVLRKGSVARGLQGNLDFNLIDSREGFILLEALEKRFGAGGASARYDVSVELMLEESDLVLTVATGLSRITIDGIAKVKVTDRSTGKEVFSEKIRDVIGYSANEETLATATSRRDARDKLVRSLADMIALRLSASAESWAA